MRNKRKLTLEKLASLATYIERMNAYHKGKTYHAAMQPELLDIDQLQADAAEVMNAAEVQANL